MDIKKNDIVLISSLSTIKLKIFKPFLLKRWPQQNIFVIRIIPPYKQEFDYSNDLPEKSFPCVIDPIWNFNRKKYGMLVNLNSENIKVIRRSVPIVLKEASNIMYLGDLWYSSVIDYYILLKEYLGTEVANAERLVIAPNILTNEAIENALDKPITTKDREFCNLLNDGMAKRFFDYNYNINSLHFFSRCLHKAGVTLKNYGISKYSLQLLYELRERPPMSEGRAVFMMQNWNDSGAYPPAIFGIGNPRSVAPILEGLYDCGLLRNKKKGLIITKSGHAFLEMLDPGCRDIDLSGKLEMWRQNWPDSKKEMETYIIDYFNRQKDFMTRFNT